jgi:hypothetical protein
MSWAKGTSGAGKYYGSSLQRSIRGVELRNVHPTPLLFHERIAHTVDKVPVKRIYETFRSCSTLQLPPFKTQSHVARGVAVSSRYEASEWAIR